MPAPQSRTGRPARSQDCAAFPAPIPHPHPHAGCRTCCSCARRKSGWPRTCCSSPIAISPTPRTWSWRSWASAVPIIAPCTSSAATRESPCPICSAILRITKQSLARVLSALVEQGYVAQAPGSADRRQRLLTLTRPARRWSAGCSSPARAPRAPPTARPAPPRWRDSAGSCAAIMDDAARAYLDEPVAGRACDSGDAVTWRGARHATGTPDATPGGATDPPTSWWSTTTPGCARLLSRYLAGRASASPPPTTPPMRAPSCAPSIPT